MRSESSNWNLKLFFMAKQRRLNIKHDFIQYETMANPDHHLSIKMLKITDDSNNRY